jgi:hypothetical protein
MAKVYLDKFEDLGTSGIHSATSWQVAKDPEFTKIIDESLEDKVNLISWNTPLPKLQEDIVEGEVYPYYSDLTALYARVKVHIDETVSNWFVLGPKSQLVQKVIITENDKEDIWTDSHLPDKTDPTDNRVGWDKTEYDKQDTEFKSHYKSEEEYEKLYQDPNILTPNKTEGETI